MIKRYTIEKYKSGIVQLVIDFSTRNYEMIGNASGATQVCYIFEDDKQNTERLEFDSKLIGEDIRDYMTYANQNKDQYVVLFVPFAMFDDDQFIEEKEFTL